MSNAVFAQGTLLKIGDGGSPTESFTMIAEVADIGGPELALRSSPSMVPLPPM